MEISRTLARALFQFISLNVIAHEGPTKKAIDINDVVLAAVSG
jgi:hypothetical protein